MVYEKQKNRWGYLNNPEWANPSRPFARGGQDDYDGREGSEPQVWTPPNQHRLSHTTIKRHHQCGHWHMGTGITPTDQYLYIKYALFQQSVDTYKGAIAIGGHIYEDPYGYAVLIYENGAWYGLGSMEGAYGFMTPYTLRLNDDMAVVFGSFSITDDPDKEMLGVICFPKGDFPYQHAVWKIDWADPNSDEFDETMTVYNCMDLQGNRIACAARMYAIGGVVTDIFQIKVSYDAGKTFPTTWTFPVAPTHANDTLRIRMSEDGIVWIVYNRYATKHLELWKSNAGATSWSKIWDYDYSGDIGIATSITYEFDILEADGKDISIRARAVAGGGSMLVYSILYQSTNYGVSFAKTTNTYPWTFPPTVYDPDTPYVNFTANGQYIVAGADSGFKRSSDYGASYATVAPPHVLDEYYVDQQKYGSDIVYSQCAASFSPPAPSTDFLSLMFSQDNGATWEVIQSPLPNIAITDPILVAAYPGYFITYSGTDYSTITITPIDPVIPSFSHDRWTSIEIVPAPLGNGIRTYNVVHWEDSWSY